MAFLITTLRKRRQIKRLQNTTLILQNTVSRQEKEIKKQDEELFNNLLKSFVEKEELEQKITKLQELLKKHEQELLEKQTGKTWLNTIRKWMNPFSYGDWRDSLRYDKP